MGLSTTYANMVLFVFILSILYFLMGVYGDYLGDTSPEVKAQADRVRGRLDTTILLSSATTDGNDVIMYVLNSGKTTLDPNCTDFYIDREWIPRSSIDELRILNTSFDPGLWNPDETLRMQTQYDTDDGQPHEAKVVACNGAMDSRIFYHT